ncbi:glycoside hydrolase family 57 protein [Endomicrobium proavitum]|uniref:Glycoside hydrolase family protein n=1 Tax=Endomicrobium proavitum TaxID=1408281 RepID=A0A0G3WJ33_9BACT|nr:1,4-alpha-glucan branching protein domain-containing protein [Endomicrobium proavitum]AKL98338.1 Glycoside hydrolase family protein [Endomicrobium proavitum]
MNPKGYWCLQLHAHLPFVRHPEYSDFLEEDWLYEAISETYLPLLNVFENLVKDNIDFRLTMTITPTLANMLADPLLQLRYYERLKKQIDLIEKELARTENALQFRPAAQMYAKQFQECKQVWEKYNGNILTGFKNLQDAGKIEIITCCATHGFLPLMNNPAAQRAQIRVACDDYQRHFGRRPRGIWLAECAYYPGIDEILKDEGIRFFFLEAHGILYAEPRPKYGVFAPVYAPSGVAAFARDTETAQQVWSAESGYPGDSDYREFYRDLGYDLDYDYVKPYLHSDGIRRNIGIKYHKITGKVSLSDKQPYSPQDAKNKADTHAGNFLFNRTKQAEYLSEILDRTPLVVSMYDAELFGHWWFEGPQFLNFLFRKMHCDQDIVKPITPIEYLEKFPLNQVVSPAASSWGDKGYYEVWLNSSNDYIYRHLHKAAERMTELAKRFPSADGILEMALNQCAREVLLAQSSDWAFIMTTGTMVEYAQKRTREHIANFTTLYEQINNNSIDAQYLKTLEDRNNIFAHINYRVYAQ